MESKLADYCIKNLNLTTPALSASYYYASLPLCIIDAVYSIGANYTSTQKAVAHYCNIIKTPYFRGYGSAYPAPHVQRKVSEFFCDIASYPTGLNAAVQLFNNRQRTSSKAGILKADAVKLFAECLMMHGVETFQAIQYALTNKDIEKDIRSIKGQSSGITWKYFLMLAGSDDFIKPDRMIQRFVYKGTGENFSTDEVQNLLKNVLSLLIKNYPSLTLRLLDHEIWKYERGR